MRHAFLLSFGIKYTVCDRASHSFSLLFLFFALNLNVANKMGSIEIWIMLTTKENASAMTMAAATATTTTTTLMSKLRLTQTFNKHTNPQKHITSVRMHIVCNTCHNYCGWFFGCCIVRLHRLINIHTMQCSQHATYQIKL